MPLPKNIFALYFNIGKQMMKVPLFENITSPTTLIYPLSARKKAEKIGV
jgi:hypothetical protein